MDIKGVIRQVIPLNVQRKDDVRERPKTGEATDRDGNGQMPGQEQESRRNLSQEELADAVKILEALPGVKENNLTIRMVSKDGVTVVFVEDGTGKVVRRIPEAELSLILKNKEKKSGHLLDKAM